MIQTWEWWAFLVLGPAVYWLAPAAWRTWLLAVGSLGLIARFAGSDLLLMLALAGTVFVGFRLEPGRWPAGLIRAARSAWPAWLVLGYFVWSKYLPALANALGGQGSFLDLAVPLGVSYFSFKLLHYAIEMRRGNFPPHGPGDFVAWLFLAPIFTAGPIERFEHYLAQRRDQRFEGRFLVEGVLRIAIGLCKKFFLGVLVLELLSDLSGGGLVVLAADPGAQAPSRIWAVLLLTLAYVYLDFSAYSDIAIGSARLFGLTIMENFNLPFLATSLQKFWQRWHMTLANWCRAYVYMPMIGWTRNPYWAVIAAFAAMGLWHSASPHWLIWGLWHGAGLAFLLFWGRFAMKRRITVMKTRTGQAAGWAMTMGYVALGGTFTALHGKAPVTAAVGLILAAFGMAG